MSLCGAGAVPVPPPPLPLPAHLPAPPPLPRSNPEAGRAELKRFHEIQEAYRVLRDPAKRAQYDSMRAAGFGGEGFDEAAPGGGGGATPWGQPSVDERDFDARFDEWWKKMSQE